MKEKYEIESRSEIQNFYAEESVLITGKYIKLLLCKIISRENFITTELLR